jgi:AcrR family transcriptional regulator
MSRAAPLTQQSLGSTSHSVAQIRVLAAALALFAEHGVGGTSIRMIAEAIGVTKAAIYYQFKTKEEIVLAAARLGFAKLEWALDAAESEESPSQAREFLIRQVIEIALEQRSVTRVLHNDPVMLRLLTEHEPSQHMFERMHRLMIGKAADAGARMRVAMLAGAIAAGTVHPLVADLDDNTVRSHLLELARFLLAPRAESGGRAAASRRDVGRTRPPGLRGTAIRTVD